MLQDRPILAKALGNGVYSDTFSNGQIVAYMLTSAANRSIDTWINAQAHIMETWPVDRPICILADQSSQEQLTFTPAMKARFSALVDASCGKTGRLAVVVGKGFYSQVETEYFASTGDLHLRIFQDRALALMWLQEVLTPARSPNLSRL